MRTKDALDMLSTQEVQKLLKSRLLLGMQVNMKSLSEFTTGAINKLGKVL